MEENHSPPVQQQAGLEEVTGNGTSPEKNKEGNVKVLHKGSMEAGYSAIPPGMTLVDGFPSLRADSTKDKALQQLHEQIDENSSGLISAENSHPNAKSMNKKISEPKLKAKEQIASGQKVSGQKSAQDKPLWVNLFRNNRSPSHCAELQDVSVGGRTGACVLEEEDLLPLQTAWGFTLIGYFAGKKPSYWYVQKLINSWNCKVIHHVHQSGWIVFKFEEEKAMTSVLEGGPYFAVQIPLLLKPMPELFRFDDEDMKLMPVWISLHCLPKDCWGRGGMNKIVSEVGIPLRMDERTSKLDAVSYARALVIVDASKELTHQVEVTVKGKATFIQEITYDYIPTYCSNCKCIGHIAANCARKKAFKKIANLDSGNGRLLDDNLVVGQNFLCSDVDNLVATDGKLEDDHCTNGDSASEEKYNVVDITGNSDLHNVEAHLEFVQKGATCEVPSNAVDVTALVCDSKGEELGEETVDHHQHDVEVHVEDAVPNKTTDAASLVSDSKGEELGDAPDEDEEEESIEAAESSEDYDDDEISGQEDEDCDDDEITGQDESDEEGNGSLSESQQDNDGINEDEVNEEEGVESDKANEEEIESCLVIQDSYKSMTCDVSRLGVVSINHSTMETSMVENEDDFQPVVHKLGGKNKEKETQQSTPNEENQEQRYGNRILSTENSRGGRGRWSAYSGVRGGFYRGGRSDYRGRGGRVRSDNSNSFAGRFRDHYGSQFC